MEDLDIGGTFMTVQLADLKIDPTYQRSIKRNARRIRNDFDRNAVGSLHVGRRQDGSLWLIDGRQRCCAMLDLGFTEWHAYVIESSGPRYEAFVFQLLNGGNRIGLTQRELFRAAVEAEDPIALAVVRVVGQHGLTTTGGNSHWPNIQAMGTIYRGMRVLGEKMFSRLIGTLVATWPDQEAALRGHMLAGWIKLYTRFGEVINDKRLIKQAKEMAPLTILNNAKFSPAKDLATGVMHALADLYNKKLSQANRLKIVSADSEKKDREAS